MKDLEFFPRAAARTLGSRTSRTVGILTSNINIPYYAATAYAIERELFEKNYTAILCDTGGLTETNIQYIRMLASNDVCGIICIGSVLSNTIVNSSILSEFSNIRFVLTSCIVAAPNVSCVLIDEQHGTDVAVSHMISRGYDKIFFVKDANSYSGIQKKNGFLSAMRKYGLSVERDCVFETERGLDGGKAAVKRIIESGREFNGLIFGDDLTAVGGMKYLQQMGYSVPDDVAVIGCNNSIVSLCSSPTITTMDYKFDLVGRFSVALLEASLKGDTTNNIITITPDFIIRDST